MNEKDDLYINSRVFSSKIGSFRRLRSHLWRAINVTPEIYRPGITIQQSRHMKLESVYSGDERLEYLDTTEYIEFPVIKGGLGLAPNFPTNPYVLQAFLRQDRRFGYPGKLTIGQMCA